MCNKMTIPEPETMAAYIFLYWPCFQKPLYIKASTLNKQQTPPRNEMGFIVSIDTTDVAEKERLELSRRFPDLRP